MALVSAPYETFTFQSKKRRNGMKNKNKCKLMCSSEVSERTAGIKRHNFRTNIEYVAQEGKQHLQCKMRGKNNNYKTKKCSTLFGIYIKDVPVLTGLPQVSQCYQLYDCITSQLYNYAQKIMLRASRKRPKVNF